MRLWIPGWLLPNWFNWFLKLSNTGSPEDSTHDFSGSGTGQRPVGGWSTYTFIQDGNAVSPPGRQMYLFRSIYLAWWISHFRYFIYVDLPCSQGARVFVIFAPIAFLRNLLGSWKLGPDVSKGGTNLWFASCCFLDAVTLIGCHRDSYW